MASDNEHSSDASASSEDLADHRRGAKAKTEVKDTDKDLSDNDDNDDADSSSKVASAGLTETTKKGPSSEIAAVILGVSTNAKPTEEKTSSDNEGVKAKDATKHKIPHDDGESTATEDEYSLEENSRDEENLNAARPAGKELSLNEKTIAEDLVGFVAKFKDLPASEAKEGQSTETEQPFSSDTNADPAESSQKSTNPRNSSVGKDSFKMELNFQHQNLAQKDQLRSDHLRSTHFPSRLHNMLDDAERMGHADIVSWYKGGDCFKIHKPTQLIHVLKNYFRQSKFKSFLRQLQGYDFKRITRGVDRGVVSHPLFVKGRRSFCTYMKRKRVAKMTVTQMTKDNNSRRTSTSQITQSVDSSKPMVFGLLNRTAINPVAQDVLCVPVPNVHLFQGNKKLASIVKKITVHYKTADASVKRMIVNEITTRLQKGGSRFLKLSNDGLFWTECNPEEIIKKVTSCFETEIRTSVHEHPGTIDLTSDGDNVENSTRSDDELRKSMSGAAPSVGARLGSTSKQEPPRDQDVVLRGGQSSEKEGNTYLITMIQANVGQQVDSDEMKRIKCRAILDRMKRRGSRFFLKLKDTGADDDMYQLSDTEAQEVIMTAFSVEQKKIAATNGARSASSALQGLGEGHSGLGDKSTFGAISAHQNEASAVLNRLRANNEQMNLMSSQASLKRPMEAHATLKMMEKRATVEADERIKLFMERARQQQQTAALTASGFMNNLPLNSGNNLLASSMSNSLYGANQMEQLLKERQAKEMFLKTVAARNQFAAGQMGQLAALGEGGMPNGNSHFVDLLKKYSGQDTPW